ncbi:LOG family protein [Streptomyces sp. NPDC058385]|uniref:LOG family protein n=1 Tax=Streptomyces sp. NPDC058385 TaxID=3346473 RepID=UPI0036610306
MHERKAVMADRAGFTALPGRLATLEELFKVWSWRQLDFLSKPVGFLGSQRLWVSLLAALRGINGAGFPSVSPLDGLADASELPGLQAALDERVSRGLQPVRGGALR